MDIRDYIKDEKIPWVDRISNASTLSVQSFCNGLKSILLAPVIFFKIFFTSRRKVIDIIEAIADHPEIVASDLRGLDNAGIEPFQYPTAPSADCDSWKREHDKLYGDYGDKDER